MLPWVSSWRVGARGRRDVSQAAQRARSVPRRAERSAAVHGSGIGLDHRPDLLDCGRGRRPATGTRRCGDRLRQHVLDVVGRDVVALAEQARARAARSTAMPARGAQALDEPGARARRRDQRLQVVEQRVRGMHATAPRCCAAISSAGVMTGAAGRIASRRSRAGEQLAFALAVGIAERDAHQEAVELRLGQRVGAELVGRVLGRDDEERRAAARASRLRP